MSHPVTPPSFSARLRDETILLHHRTLTELCEWADGVRGLPITTTPEEPATITAPVVSLEQTIETAFDVVLRKIVEMGLLLPPDQPAVESYAAAPPKEVETNTGNDNDEYRNSNRGRLSWGPAQFSNAVNLTQEYYRAQMTSSSEQTSRDPVSYLLDYLPPTVRKPLTAAELLPKD
jgi:hypothetical protein